MRREGKRTLAAIAIAASATLAAGCASASQTSTVTAPHTSPPSPQVSPTPARTPAAAERTPKQRAEADAAAILASFAVPPGATKLSGPPSGGHGVLSEPDSAPATPDLVDDVAWWEVPGQPQQVLAWEKTHLPARFSLAGYGTGQSGTALAWNDDFALPAITGVLNARSLMVEAVAAGNGKTDLRVDAQVTWIPARPASEVVPSAARAVTLSLLPNINVHTTLPAPVTMTAPSRVRALAALVDGLPEFPPGSYSCPAGFGDALVLTFRARPGGPALAVATVQLSGCEEVDFTVGGKGQPALGGPDDGRPFAAHVLKAAGLHWQLPGFG